MKHNTPVVIFAGGKSTRMGKDKALLPFGRYTTLSQYQYHRLSKFFTEVYLSAKENKFNFKAQIIIDKYPEDSPLVGIISIFETLNVEKIFILSVDAPFISKEIIDKLIQHRADCDAVVAKSSSGLQPLCAVYCRSILDIAKKHLEEKNHRLTSLLNDANTHTVYFEKDTYFSNLNYPHDYEKALTRI